MAKARGAEDGPFRVQEMARSGRFARQAMKREHARRICPKPKARRQRRPSRQWRRQQLSRLNRPRNNSRGEMAEAAQQPAELENVAC